MNRVYVRKGAFFSDTKVIILFDFSKRKCSFFHRKKYGMPYPTFARPQGCRDFTSRDCCHKAIGEQPLLIGLVGKMPEAGQADGEGVTVTVVTVKKRGGIPSLYTI